MFCNLRFANTDEGELGEPHPAAKQSARLSADSYMGGGWQSVSCAIAGRKSQFNEDQRSVGSESIVEREETAGIRPKDSNSSPVLSEDKHGKVIGSIETKSQR